MRGSISRIILLTSLSLARFQAQGPIASQGSVTQARSQYFSGFVASVTPDSLVVTRKSPAESKTFLMDQQTKVDGKLRANARVTVRFESTPNGDRAIRIIVRG